MLLRCGWLPLLAPWHSMKHCSQWKGPNAIASTNTTVWATCCSQSCKWRCFCTTLHVFAPIWLVTLQTRACCRLKHAACWSNEGWVLSSCQNILHLVQSSLPQCWGIFWARKSTSSWGNRAAMHKSHLSTQLEVIEIGICLRLWNTTKFHIIVEGTIVAPTPLVLRP